jgi:hypothetical protein
MSKSSEEEFNDPAQYRIIKSDGTETIKNTHSKLGLKTMQKIVGGHIEILKINKETLMVVAEEGIPMGLPRNMKASQIYGKGPIRGDVIIARKNLID